eukprot:gene2555-biopygen978
MELALLDNLLLGSWLEGSWLEDTLVLGLLGIVKAVAHTLAKVAHTPAKVAHILVVNSPADILVPDCMVVVLALKVRNYLLINGILHNLN